MAKILKLKDLLKDLLKEQPDKPQPPKKDGGSRGRSMMGSFEKRK